MYVADAEGAVVIGVEVALSVIAQRVELPASGVVKPAEGVGAVPMGAIVELAHGLSVQLQSKTVVVVPLRVTIRGSAEA